MIPKLTPEQRAELAIEEQRPLSPEEFAARVAAPWTDREREDFDALCEWFQRRYPTPLERLRATTRLARQQLARR